MCILPRVLTSQKLRHLVTAININIYKVCYTDDSESSLPEDGSVFEFCSEAFEFVALLKEVFVLDISWALLLDVAIR